MKKLLLFLSAISISSVTFGQLCSFSTSVPQANVGIYTPSSALPGSSYVWDFGDGMTGTSLGPVAHTYMNGGAYTVCLNVFDTLGALFCTYCDSVFITSSSAGCNFTVFQNPGSTIVDFLVSVPAGYAAHWDYGDGSTGSGPNPWHNYANGGSYTVCVDIIDTNTLVSACHSCQTITIGTTNNCYFTAIPDSMTPSLYYFFGAPAFSTSSLSWSFGDGSSGTGSNPHHTYATAGTYYVCMDEVSPNGAILCHYCDSVVVTSGGGGGVTCNFTFSVVPGSNPTLVTCISTVNAPAPYTVHWDFGNGMTTIGVAGTAQYFAPGVYTITMTVTDGMGNILCSNIQAITVNAPAASCTAYYVASMAGMTGAFIDLSSGITSNTTFSWSFGDGTGSSARFPQHTYAMPGTYSVCLTIADTGCSDQYCTTVIADTNTVNPGPCQANFVTLQGAPYNVLVVNLSTGNNLSYFWDFGDGSTSSQQYPSHFYSTTGSYVLCLTVNDGLLGCTSTFCDTLTVDSMGNVLRTTSTGFTVNVVSPSMLTGVNETPSDVSAVSVYPNPVTDRIIISGTEGAAGFRIMDLRGTVVAAGVLSSRDTVLDATKLSPGSYLVEVEQQNGDRTFRRFIRQ